MKNLLVKISFILCTLLLSTNSVWAYSYSGLTVNAEGSGTVAVTKNSTKPADSAFGSTSTQNTDHDGFWDVTVKDTYYIWVKPSSGWRCTGISGDDLTATWNDAGYYTVSFKGNTKRDSRTMTATFVAGFYSKAVAHAVPSALGKVTVGVGFANVGDGTDSRGWVGYGTANAYDWTYREASSGRTYKYHFYKEDPTVGYTFDGWYKDAACSNKKTSDADFVEEVTATTTEKTDLEYWACWKPNTYVVSFNSHGGTSKGNTTVTYDATYGASTNWPTDPTRTNCTFDGWYTEETGGTKVEASTTVKITSAQTLHAHWKTTYYGRAESHADPTSGGGTYVSCNGNTPSQQSQYKANDSSNRNLTSLTYVTPKCPAYFAASTYVGYTFDGWYTETNKGGTKKSSALSYTEEFDVTSTSSSNRTTIHRYAHWTPNTYTVKFNGNGGSSPADKTVTYDATYGTLTPSTREGYTFAGWWTDASAGTQVTSSTIVKITATQTLYAHWTANPYTITLNNQSATTAGTPNIAVTYDANTNLTSAITTPTKTGCTFEGYYTAVNGGGVQIIDNNGNVLASKSGYTDASRNWKYANNIELYAYWKQNQTIQWTLPDGAGVEYPTGQVMGAVAYGDYSLAPSGLEIAYSTEPSSVATIVDGKLNVLIPNATVTVCANQGGNHDYNAAEVTVCKTFTTAGCTPDGHSVTATNITYGQMLASSTLSGTVTAGGVAVAGTLTWVEPTTAPDATVPGEEPEQFAVLFTPTNTAVYGAGITFNVPVTVNKATPVITWNITNNLRENTIYSHFVTSTNNEKTLTVSEESEYLSVSGLVLTVGEIGDSEKSGITLTAHQDASANYNEITATKTITIYPKVAQCLAVSVNSEDIMTNMGSRFEGKTGAWCSTSESGSASFVVDVSYTQYVGIQLGNWNEGFSGVKNIGDFVELVKNWDLVPSDKSIELAFTGVPDELTISTAMQHVSYNLFGWKDAPDGTPTPTWTIYQRSVDGAYSSVTTFTGNITDHKVALNPATRYIKISLNSAFAGFVTKLEISRKNYIHADQASMVFGTEAKPLQAPQTLTLSYSSLGDCTGTDDHITVTSNNPAFYVDETTITENVGIEQQGTYTVRVRCNDVNKSGKITFESNDGTKLEVPVSSTKPNITTTATNIFQTGTEHVPASGTSYRALRIHNFSDCFNGSPVFDTLYIYGVSESSAANRQWSYDASKGYKVPAVTASNVHTPCFVYKKDGSQYTYVRTFDASAKTLNVADSNKRGFVGYRAEAPAANAIQVSGANAEIYLNNTEIVASGAPVAVNATSKVYANGTNILSSTGNAAVQLSGATTLSIEDTWKGATSAILALRPAASYPSIDLGSASGRVDINGTQLELHNNTAHHLAIAHMDGTTEKYDGEVHINDGSIGGEATLGMPKATFIDGGTFNDGDIAAYTLKGQPKRPRNQFGEMLSRQKMTLEALVAGYGEWYRHDHLTLDGEAKVNPMLMDEEVWIFEGQDGTNTDASEKKNWNKGAVPGEDDDVLINAPMIVSDGEQKFHSMTINWVGSPEPAVTVTPTGGLTVGEGGIDALKVENPAQHLALRAGTEGATKGQTGFLRIHPASAEPMPQATVELYSIGYYNMGVTDHNMMASWQFVGSPMVGGADATSVFRVSFIYDWDEASDSWKNNRNSLKLQPFAGYATSQYFFKEGMLITNAGQLVSNEGIIDVPLNYKGEGHNVVANSFVAPIDITKFEDGDFVNADNVIYLFNTGSKTDVNALEEEEDEEKREDVEAKGQFIPIPVGSARDMKDLFSLPTVIAPMQGFCVNATADNAKIKFDYNKLVWNGAESNAPLRVKNQHSESTAHSLCVSLSADGWHDKLYMLESEDYSTNYENGYDAIKRMSGSLNVFAIEDSKELAVDATNSIVGTRVGVRTGEETEYTFRFSHIQSEDDLALWDKEAKMKVYINEDVEYTFYAVPNSTITERFEIVAVNVPTVTTGVDEIQNETHIQKFIKDNQLYILKDGVLYNASGAVVRK